MRGWVSFGMSQRVCGEPHCTWNIITRSQAYVFAIHGSNVVSDTNNGSRGELWLVSRSQDVYCHRDGRTIVERA